MIFIGPVLAKDYAGFIVKLINNYPHIKNNLEDYYFYMDNAKIHKAKM